MSICIVDRCRQGRTACPTPAACSYIEQRQEQAADAAGALGPDDEPATMGDGAGVILWPLAVLAVLTATMLVARWFA